MYVLVHVEHSTPLDRERDHPIFGFCRQLATLTSIDFVGDYREPETVKKPADFDWLWDQHNPRDQVVREYRGNNADVDEAG